MKYIAEAALKCLDYKDCFVALSEKKLYIRFRWILKQTVVSNKKKIILMFCFEKAETKPS